MEGFVLREKLEVQAGNQNLQENAINEEEEEQFSS